MTQWTIGSNSLELKPCSCQLLWSQSIFEPTCKKQLLTKTWEAKLVNIISFPKPSQDKVKLMTEALLGLVKEAETHRWVRAMVDA